jgi:hypothetical protein
MQNNITQFFRNKYDLTSLEGILVDANSLWKLDTSQNILILEDDDQHLTSQLTENFESAL